jgi:hypothetical protein
MPKKSHSSSSAHVSASPTEAHAAEYRLIKHDLWKVIGLNTLYLILVLAVYFTNAKSHYLERWLGNVANI